MKRLISNLRPWAVLLLLAGSSAAALAQDDLGYLEEKAVLAAVKAVSPSVVRIQTVGGLESVASGQTKILIGTGPTTGVIVSPDGYIISSAFNFISKPSSILITLPDGSRAPARLIATDHSRQLTLLKVDAVALKLGELPVPTAATASDVEVGQWACALGRTFEGDSPNLSEGIVSAVRRIWGKAIQTDAKISPANYGGPLIDLHGRVMGILVPMSPQATSELAGVEWYDSGIGFAVPFDHVLRVVPTLKKGQDLHPGVMGISFKGNDQLAGSVEVGAVRAASPAADAGLKPGDQLVEVAGEKVERQMQVKHAIGPRYAGEEITVAVLRNKERKEFTLRLVDKLLPYQHPALGLLPLRTLNSKSAGVTVRHIFPESGAAKAGLKAGDVITALGETPIKNRDDLLEALLALKHGTTVAVTFQRDGKDQKADLALGDLPTVVPDSLPPARPAEELPAAAAKPEVGVLEDRKITEFENSYLVYVPQNYHPMQTYGLVVWLHEPGGYKTDELLALWRPVCDAQGLIFVAPKSSNTARWLPQETQFLRKMVDELISNYSIDPLRVIAAGYQAGGSMAFVLAQGQREVIRGAALIDAAPAGNLQENEPNFRVSYYFTNAEKSPRQKQIAAAVDRLTKAKFPVTLFNQGEKPHPLTEADCVHLARWIDTLDRL